jgi:V8-like Glu-specific endopeptidase
MLRTTRRCTAAAGLALAMAVTLPTVSNAQAATSGTGSGKALPATGALTSAPAAPDFSGTVALDNCSGSIVRWTTSQPSDQALLLTNGHCHDFMGAREVDVNQHEVRSVDLLTSDGSVAGTVQTATLLYATMWKTDVSLYQLNQTYRDLKNQYGVPAFTLADSVPAPKDQPIAVISGYWRREYDCHLNGFAYRLHEDVWDWNLSLRYEDGKCQIIGGTSGSPVLDSNRVQIGINNTINEDGERCTFDNPCEENRKGRITVHLHRGYGQETWVFYTCLTNNALDLGKKGCRLPSP